MVRPLSLWARRDIKRASGTLFGTFYTYDAAGEPEWLWIRLPDGADVAGDLTRFRREGGALVGARAGGFTLAATDACPTGFPARVQARFTASTSTCAASRSRGAWRR